MVYLLLDLTGESVYQARGKRIDANSWALTYHRPGHNEMKRTILGFCGIKVVKISEFAPVKGSSQQQSKKWIAIAKELGSKS
jgi:hypothetical protein